MIVKCGCSADTLVQTTFYFIDFTYKEMVYWAERSSASATKSGSGAVQQHMMEPKDIGSDTQSSAHSIPKFITPTSGQRDPG